MNIIHTFFKYTEFTTTPGPRVKTTPLQWKFHLESGWMIAAELDPNISDLVWPILLPQPKTYVFGFGSFSLPLPGRVKREFGQMGKWVNCLNTSPAHPSISWTEKK